MCKKVGLLADMFTRDKVGKEKPTVCDMGDKTSGHAPN